MRVFIRKQSEFENLNFYNAYSGFNKLGFEIVYFEKELPSDFTKYDMVVDYIQGIKNALYRLGIEPPTDIDYPEELEKYYGRKIWKSDLETISNSPELYPVFIKPTIGKLFDGRLVSSFKDLIGCGNRDYNPDIYCSEPVNFVSEWRVFIRYGKVLDARPYKGSPFSKLDETIVLNCIKDFTSASNGYSLDFGLTDDNRVLLLEVNHGYSLGCYGLLDIFYAKLMYAEWCYMVGIEDELSYF
jgi:hypothetical protein